MTLALYGLPVSRGIAIGKAYVLSRHDLNVVECRIAASEIEAEITRFRQALVSASVQLKQALEQIPSSTPVDIRSFIDTHLLMLNDNAISEAPVSIIRTQRCSAAWALKLQRDALIKVFDAMDDDYLRTRQDDVDYVVKCVQRILLNQSPHSAVEEADHLVGAIVLADDLSPAEAALMHSQGVAALVTEHGGQNSHTAILARSLGIPALVGVHRARHYLKTAEEIIVDGRQGVLLADLDRSVLGYYKIKCEEDIVYRSTLDQLREQPAITQDGQKIDLLANVELPEDLAGITHFSAEGVGLYRTEMLFLNSDTVPDEHAQYREYLKVINAAKGARVTIRTLDVGSDKTVAWHHKTTELVCNPALGLRGVRLSLKGPALFKVQLRAILRASMHGPIAIMIPMLSNLHEVKQALSLIEEAKQELRDQGVAYSDEVPIGGMIEVPAAALISKELAKHLDFLSIGTNDLIQYVLAADRIDDSVNYLYDPLHPGVLRLIQMTIEAGRSANIPVAMCGEMAGDVQYTRLLLGLGLKVFSMPPAFLLEVKRRVNTSNFSALSAKVSEVLALDDTSSISALVEEFNARD